ncbi:MAG TPA: ornithine cyclodeaminase family protein [Thermoplasmata archaeon]|nr:ornithine cyclodeaminase family protein [Thermoplasmata archaeon]
MKTLNDADVDRLLPMKDALHVMEAAFRAKSEGHLNSPPRHYVRFPHGSLVFTVGGDDVGSSVVGFRVYNTFPGATEDGGDHPDRTQATMVFDSSNGTLQGTVLGTRLGVLRTSAIGGTALKYLANPRSERIGFIGSGLQAKAQLDAAMAVLPLKSLRVFSPTRTHREGFATWAAQRHGLAAAARETAREVAEQSDVVICSTVSLQPVIEAEWIRPGTHVTSMGSKTRSEHEIGLSIAEQADLIATDSPAQMSGYSEPHLLQGTSVWGRVADLAAIVASRAPGRTTPAQRSLFLSEGLAGTEVLLAAELLRRA